MIYKSDSAVYEYKAALTQLKSILGISLVDWEISDALAPYIVKITEYLDKTLIDLGTSSKKSLIQTIFNLAEQGGKQIVDGKAKELATTVGARDSSDDLETPPETDFVSYNQDRFIYTWAWMLWTLSMRLKFQYSSLLYQAAATTSGCSDGDTIADWENFSSLVEPEDEEYDTYDYTAIS